MKRKKFEIIVLWGSSLPHLDVYDLHLFLAGARQICTNDCLLYIEQADLLPRILVNNFFKHVLIEGNALSLFKSFDDFRGVQKRLMYRLPDLEFMGYTESSL